jgi:translocon-associated protein subunit alpha
MSRIFWKFVLMLLIVLPTTLMLAGNDGPSMVVRAQEEDVVEGEEDEEASVVEDEATDEPGAMTEEGGTPEEEEEEEKPLKPSADADTYLLFTAPNSMDLPAGQAVKLLVGFINNGDKDFIVENMEASFRYPQDYSFHIQNFTVSRYNRLVEPKREATFAYQFTPSETFNARPFGLSINLNYKDNEGNFFQDAVFNETINIVEPDEGLDGETFFLYVFLAAIAVLLLVGAQQLLASFSKKRMSGKPKAIIEVGTQNKGDVDLDWLPEETLNKLKNSPGRSPKLSPRQRSKRRSAGVADE